MPFSQYPLFAFPIYKNNHACMLCRSVCGSSQPDALSIGPPVPPLQPTGKKKRVQKAKKDKRKGGNKPKGATKQKQALVPVPPQSPAMCTRSKAPESPAMSTRSKRKILDWLFMTSLWDYSYVWYADLWHETLVAHSLMRKLIHAAI